MPGELWTAAVKLAQQDGLAETARALRLDYGALKKKVRESAASCVGGEPAKPDPKAHSESSPATESRPEPATQCTPSLATLLSPAGDAFVELVHPLAGVVCSCELEVQSASGARLRAELRGVSPSSLAVILREFAG